MRRRTENPGRHARGKSRGRAAARHVARDAAGQRDIRASHDSDEGDGVLSDGGEHTSIHSRRQAVHPILHGFSQLRRTGRADTRTFFRTTLRYESIRMHIRRARRRAVADGETSPPARSFDRQRRDRHDQPCANRDTSVFGGRGCRDLQSPRNVGGCNSLSGLSFAPYA